MPKELTHWMLAERALESLPNGSRLKSIIAQHRSAYLGGAVLPDTLAHMIRGPHHTTARRLGQQFHDTPVSSYQPLIRAERRLPGGLPDQLLACYLGVISHLEADAALHPYVYALSGSADIGRHYRVETAIDVHFVKSHAAAAHRRLETLLCPSTRGAMVTAARHLFDPEEELPLEAIEQSLALHCRFQAMYDRTVWKLAVRLLGKVCGSPFSEQRQLFYPLRGKPLGKFGASETAWRHPESGETKTSTLEELAQEAVERTSGVFRQIEEAGSLAAALAELPGANLLTGLHGIKKNP